MEGSMASAFWKPGEAGSLPSVAAWSRRLGSAVECVMTGLGSSLWMSKSLGGASLAPVLQ